MSQQKGPGAQGLGKGARYQVVPRVLVFARHGKEVLLLRGALDKKIWPGMYNGIGGHVDPGEDPLLTARRELREGSGLDLPAEDFSLRAIVHIDMGSDNPGIVLFVFVAGSARTEVIASEEGAPEWKSMDDLDSLPLVEDLPWLMPKVLDNSTGQVRFIRYSYDDAGALQIAETL